ncbi:hypothetical protein V6Z12_A01G196300 [Gossypium hirsutum]
MEGLLQAGSSYFYYKSTNQSALNTVNQAYRACSHAMLVLGEVQETKPPSRDNNLTLLKSN